MTALPRHLKPALETALSSGGRYDARKIAEFMGLSLREFSTLLQRDVSVLSRNGDSERLQVGLRPLVIVLDLISSTDAPPQAIRTWLRSPIPGLGYRVPLEMIREGQTEELIDTLAQVVEGTPGLILDDPTLRQALRGLALSSFNGYTYRGVNTGYLTSVNSVTGSLRGNGRFHHKGDRLGVLYVGLARAHVLSEVEDDASTIFIPGLIAPPQYHVAVFHLDLQRVLDVRQPDVHAALGTNPQELSGSWKLENYTYHQQAPTQRLARTAAREGVQAIRYLSVKAPQLENLAVFVQNVEVPIRAQPDVNLPLQLVSDAQSTPEL